jgi:hypothetical protein
MLMARPELASGPVAGSKKPISVVPTLGNMSTCFAARLDPLVGAVVLPPPPHAARKTARKLKHNKKNILDG